METQELHGRLSTLRGKYAFLKAQQADNEEKKKQLMEELEKLGYCSMGELKAAIETSNKDIKDLEDKLVRAIVTVEASAQELEDKVKGKVPAPFPFEFKPSDGPPYTQKLEEDTL
jgi:chromosome segregation ATPase